MNGDLLFVSDTFWLLAKVGLILFLMMYVVFAVIVVRQVKLMTKTLKVGFELPIELIAYLHLVFSLLVLFIAIFI